MARVCAAAIIIAGFFVTGDVAAFIQGGRTAAAAVAGLTGQVTTWLTDLRSDGPAPAKATPKPPEESSPAVTLRAAEQHGVPAIPAGTVGSIQLAALKPGDRLQLWCKGEGTQRLEQVTIDWIDPAAGEALLTRQVHSPASGWQPRRVRINAAAVENGQLLPVTPVAGSHFMIGQQPTPAATEHLGPVVAIRLLSR
jgi:hypothetical protein